MRLWNASVSTTPVSDAGPVNAPRTYPVELSIAPIAASPAWVRFSEEWMRSEHSSNAARRWLASRASGSSCTRSKSCASSLVSSSVCTSVAGMVFRSCCPGPVETRKAQDPICNSPPGISRAGSSGAMRWPSRNEPLRDSRSRASQCPSLHSISRCLRDTEPSWSSRITPQPDPRPTMVREPGSSVIGSIGAGPDENTSCMAFVFVIEGPHDDGSPSDRPMPISPPRSPRPLPGMHQFLKLIFPIRNEAIDRVKDPQIQSASTNTRGPRLRAGRGLCRSHR